MTLLDTFAPTDTRNPVHPALDFLSVTFANLVEYRRRVRQHRRDRLAFQQLLYLDDQTLKDIGYNRFDVVRANELPLHINAAQTLRMGDRYNCACN